MTTPMITVLLPRVGTTVSGFGEVVVHRFSSQGLACLCITKVGGYPDLDTWVEMLERLNDKIKLEIKSHNFTEIKHDNARMECFLWIYYKAA